MARFVLDEKTVGGYRFGDITFYGAKHLGTDWRARSPKPGFAPTRGEIVRTYFGSQGGNTMVFKNRFGFWHRWLHNSRFIKTGGVVDEGEHIFETGNTGIVNGKKMDYHLHEDMWREDPATGYPKVLRGDRSPLINPEWFYNTYLNNNEENHMDCVKKDKRISIDFENKSGVGKGSIWIVANGKKYKVGTKPDDYAMLFAIMGKNIDSPNLDKYPTTTNRKDVL